MPSDNHKIVIRSDKTHAGQYAKPMILPYGDLLRWLVRAQKYVREITLYFIKYWRFQFNRTKYFINYKYNKYCK